MAEKMWETQRVRYCSHAGKQVMLEVELVYPSEFLPDQAPHILGHRCSNALICNQSPQASCVWSGTNPAFDPFKE